MATRSVIGYLENGIYHTVYCHNDGYIDGVGKVLYNHYKTLDKIKRLISFGDMSSLDINIDPPEEVIHSFQDPYYNVCIFYGRDRGEDNTEAKELFDIHDVCKFYDYEYIYIFEDGQWTVNNVHRDNKFRPLVFEALMY